MQIPCGKVLVLLAGLLGFAGCASGDVTGPSAPVDKDAGGVPEDLAPVPDTGSAMDVRGDVPEGGGCGMTMGINPRLLPRCCDEGMARCIPASFVPMALRGQFGPCAEGLCVPDAIVQAGTSFSPRRCASLGGMDGRCLSLCIPMVAMNRALLPRADCAEDERCAPCINPLTGTSSGACDVMDPCVDGGAPRDGGGGSDGGAAGDVGAVCPYTGPPLVNPAMFPLCCTAGGAHCVPAALVPPTATSQLVPCPGGFCAPDPFIATVNRFIPTRCTSVGDAEGRCLSVCLRDVARQQGLLPVATCMANERCAPCYDPFTGAPTGACAQSCDPGPTLPPVVFPRCCGNRGRCVPATAVPMERRGNLAQRDCRMDWLCVPEENLDPAFRGRACAGINRLTGSPYTGVCVSECSRLGLLGWLALDEGGCASFHRCAPCTDPLSGRPTGAPGCPGT